MSFFTAPPIPDLRGGVNVMDTRFGAKGDGVTDDTMSIQAAVAMAAAQSVLHGSAITDVWLPSGYGFLCGPVTVTSGVRISAYGATILPSLPDMGAGAMFRSGAPLLNRFEIFGGFWAGTGNEAQNNFLFEAGIAGTGGGQDWRFQDMYVLNWATCPLYLRNVTRCRALYNDLINCNGGAFGSWYNAINFVGDTSVAQALQDLLAQGNTITGSKGAAIAIITAQAGPIDLRASILGNDCNGAAGGSTIAGAIDCESSASGQSYARQIIAHNHVHNPVSGGWGINSSEGEFGDVDISHNTVICDGGGANQGIRWVAPVTGDFHIANNRITAVTPINVTAAAFRTGNRFSAGPMAGRATLVAGTVTVNTPEIQANDNVILTVVSPGGTRGEIQLGTIVAGTSFIINSIQPGTASTLQTADTSTVYWRIDH